jgi:integrase
MAYKWLSSKYPGVRYRHHPTRKHGAIPDRYFAIRYQVDGERREEGLGWASEGWNEKDAALELAKLKRSAKVGEGPTRLVEKRQAAAARREALEAERLKQERENLTFTEFWGGTYFPLSKRDKTQRTWQREQSFFKKWLDPSLGKKPLSKISPLDLERIKRAMADAGRSPRTIEYLLAVCRQVFHLARDRGMFQGEPPTAKVKRPRYDNARIRFLSPDEAARLLTALTEVSADLHDQALLSLHCGLRAGEIFNLTWGDLDLERGQLVLRDTKNGKTRIAFMTERVRGMLAGRTPGNPEDLVFPAVGGGKRVQISAAFGQVVEDLGLNKGITDRRNRITFHTLRHTFASWLVQGGQPLYSVQQLLGHKTPTMTARYSHLAPDHLQGAVKTIEAASSGSKGKIVSLGE